MVAVDWKIYEDCGGEATFVLTKSELPLYSDNGWDSVLVLSRENSDKLALSRENSTGFSALSRDSSQKLVLGKDNFDKVVLSRENSELPDNGLIMCRENSGFLASLARETSADFGRIVFGFNEDVVLPPINLPIIKGEEHQMTAEYEDKEQSAKQAAVVLAELPTNCRAEQIGTDDKSHLPQRRKSCDPRSRGAPGPQSQGKKESKRGVHVRDRPDMQQTARDGAVHWANGVKKLRAEWQERAGVRPAFRANYAAQVEAAHGRIKSKQECLLRFLQLAADDGLLIPGPFIEGGFFGWARFAVAVGRAAEFRAGLEALFPKGFREDTLKETFRRAGLIPERWQWAQAWQGVVAFEFRQTGHEDPSKA